MDIFRLIDELEKLVENGRPWFGRVWIEEEKFFMQTHKIRNAVPEEVKRAEKILKESEQTKQQAQQDAARTVSESQREGERRLSEATERAQRIINEALERAEQLVSQSEITLRAQQQAEETLRRAERDAVAIREQADAYALDIFNKLSESLNRVMTVVDAGRQQLQQTNEHR